MNYGKNSKCSRIGGIQQEKYKVPGTAGILPASCRQDACGPRIFRNLYSILPYFELCISLAH